MSCAGIDVSRIKLRSVGNSRAFLLHIASIDLETEVAITQNNTNASKNLSLKTLKNALDSRQFLFIQR